MVEIRFSEDHTWLRVDDDGDATVGISEFAQEQLGDIVYVEPPDEGREIVVGEEVGIIESVKTTGELHAPASGTVIEVNAAVLETPELINASPLDDGWLFRLRIGDESSLADLLDEEAYQVFIEDA